MSCKDRPQNGQKTIPIIPGVSCSSDKCQENLAGLRDTLLKALDDREGGASMIVFDYDTKNLLVSELAYRTQVPAKKLDHVPVKILKAIFEKSAGHHETSYGARLKEGKFIVPVLFASASVGIGASAGGLKVASIVLGAAAFVTGLPLHGAWCEVKDAQKKNAELGQKLLRISDAIEKTRSQGCAGPCRSCDMC